MDEDDDLETLGEQLYTLIHPKHNEEAGKLTGEVTCLQKKMFQPFSHAAIRTGSMFFRDAVRAASVCADQYAAG